MQMTLLSLPKRVKAKIKEIVGPEAEKEKLLSLGILAGDEIELIARAWFGSPLAIKLGKSNFIVLRRDFAQMIVLEDF